MKKAVISLVLITSAFCALAQKPKTPEPPPDMPMDTSTKLITYTDVVQLPGVNALELYKRCKKWVYSFYKSPSTVIQKMDSVDNIFVGKNTIDMIKTLKDGTKLPANFMNYTITLNFKDGKYRYKITSFNIRDLSYHPAEKLQTETDPTKIDWDNQMLQETDAYVTDLIGKLKTAMNKPSAEVKQDNW